MNKTLETQQTTQPDPQEHQLTELSDTDYKIMFKGVKYKVKDFAGKQDSIKRNQMKFSD